MKAFVTVNAEEKDSVAQWLGARRIAFRFDVRTEPSGIDVVDFVTTDDDYARACAAIEELVAQAAEEEREASSLRCPTCGSSRIRTVYSDAPQNLIKLTSFQACEDCGRTFVPFRRSG